MLVDWPLITVYCLLPFVVGLLAYWELIIAEGAHFGPRVVVPLYDWVARRYDGGIKKFDLQTEAEILGLPLTAELADVDRPRVLDVAAGTGRVGRALLRQVAFDGILVNVDLAARMIAAGRETYAAWPGRAAWVRAPAGRLPFPAGTFDVVTCLEALEFLPDVRLALDECRRVLKPGGLLLVTNRVGWQAPLILGKTFSRAAFRQLLADLELEAVRVEPWQVDYDLAWARKPTPA
jgi:ubiquinone/menaquinone biosynthesis C-methylase UbiE